ncbi:MAG: Eco57I restriction-modification methylase domain-containing protein [Ignavibacteriae bacterium]|nr:Eco57I restriction-modification methylase domain-containing protein [Ignavibacteriota bacterium]
MLKEAFTISEYEKDIVENNIYGVDINEEAVEIAKLSLWLRTAKKGRKLSTLSNNIKCGNSLIDDPKVAGNKAFNWNEEFKEIMSNGGFDVVIGNPPYVFGGNEGISNIEKEYFKKIFITGIGKVNLFTLFIEKSYLLLKDNGEFSFIIPNTYLRVTSYHESRKYFINNFLFRELADLGNDVFQTAITTAIILIAKKIKTNNQHFLKVIKDFSGSYDKISINDIIKNQYIITSNLSAEKAELLKKINTNKSLLGNECMEIIFGVVITKNRNELIFDKQIEDYKAFLEGKDIGAYFIKPITKYLKYKPELLHRPRSPKVFEVNEKLLVQRITGGAKPLKVAYDNNRYYNKESINNIILKEDSKFDYKFILALLNSKLINWFYNNQFTNESTLTVNISKEYLSRIPIVLPSNQNLLKEKADYIINSKLLLNSIREKFIHRIKDNFFINSVPKRIDEFYLYNFLGFKTELKKQKIELSLKQQDEWEEYFNEYKTKINQLQEEITKTDNEIDVMVYKLYNLTYEEVKIVDPQFWLSEEEYNNYEIGEKELK